MITYKQLTLAEILKIVRINLATTNISFFHFLMKPLTLMKLFLFLLFLIFTPVPEDLANISFIQCLRHFLSSVFSQSRRTHSWSYFWNFPRNCVISAVLMLFWMVPIYTFQIGFFIGFTISVQSSCWSDQTNLPKSWSSPCSHDNLQYL